MSQVVRGEDGKRRCSWCTATKEYMDYHDLEWGVAPKDDFSLFESLCLESFQSGLSWRTILAKREGFREAFCQFDFNKIAKFTAQDVERLLQNEEIVRHRGKIEATINNAKQALILLEQESSLIDYFMAFTPKTRSDEIVSVSDESTELSKILKKKGWKFLGPTTVYSFMQAVGMVNDHAKECDFY